MFANLRSSYESMDRLRCEDLLPATLASSGTFEGRYAARPCVAPGIASNAMPVRIDPAVSYCAMGVRFQFVVVDGYR